VAGNVAPKRPVMTSSQKTLPSSRPQMSAASRTGTLRVVFLVFYCNVMLCSVQLMLS